MGRLQSLWPGGTEGCWEQIYRPWDFLGHLKGTQRSGKISHSPSLFLVTEEEQDNVGSRPQGSGHFRAAMLGLGGAGSVRDATRYTGREPGPAELREQVPPLSGLHPNGRTRSVSRTDHQAKRLDDHSQGGVTWSGLCIVPLPG